VAAKYGARNPSHPKNGTQQVVTDATDSSDHLQVFFNGSGMHDYRCKEQTITYMFVIVAITAGHFLWQSYI
jgi:hypothetical protein